MRTAFALAGQTQPGEADEPGSPGYRGWRARVAYREFRCSTALSKRRFESGEQVSLPIQWETSAPRAYVLSRISASRSGVPSRIKGNAGGRPGQALETNQSSALIYSRYSAATSDSHMGVTRRLAQDGLQRRSEAVQHFVALLPGDHQRRLELE